MIGKSSAPPRVSAPPKPKRRKPPAPPLTKPKGPPAPPKTKLPSKAGNKPSLPPLSRPTKPPAKPLVDRPTVPVDKPGAKPAAKPAKPKGTAPPVPRPGGATRAPVADAAKTAAAEPEAADASEVARTAVSKSAKTEVAKTSDSGARIGAAAKLGPLPKLGRTMTVPSKTVPAASPTQTGTEAPAPPKRHGTGSIPAAGGAQPRAGGTVPSRVVTKTQPDLEEEAAEIRYYLDQGLDQDAKGAWEPLWAKHPEHPELVELGRAMGMDLPEPEVLEIEAEPEADTEESDAAARDAAAKPEAEPPPAMAFAADEDDDFAGLDAAIDAALDDAIDLESEDEVAPMPGVPDGVAVSSPPVAPEPQAAAPPCRGALGPISRQGKAETEPGPEPEQTPTPVAEGKPAEGPNSATFPPGADQDESPTLIGGRTLAAEASASNQASEETDDVQPEESPGGVAVQQVAEAGLERRWPAPDPGGTQIARVPVEPPTGTTAPPLSTTDDTALGPGPGKPRAPAASPDSADRTVIASGMPAAAPYQDEEAAATMAAPLEPQSEGSGRSTMAPADDGPPTAAPYSEAVAPTLAGTLSSEGTLAPEAADDAAAEPPTDVALTASDLDGPTAPVSSLPRITLVPDDPSRPAPPKPYQPEGPPMADPFEATQANALHEAPLDPSAPTGAMRRPPTTSFTDEPAEAAQPQVRPRPPTAKPTDRLSPAPSAPLPVKPASVSKPTPARGTAASGARPDAVRLVMIGPRGEAVAERTIDAGHALILGRDAGDPWSDDRHMDLQHARVIPCAGGLSIEELGATGVFVQVAERVHVRDGDEFKVGQSRLRYELDSTSGGWGRLVVSPHGGADHFVPIGGSGVRIGREDGDIVFPGDTYVSGDHCRFIVDGNHVWIEDLGSSNGTYVRVRQGSPVAFGSLILLGHTQFKVRRV